MTNVKIGEYDLEISKIFKCLGYILQERGGIDKDILLKIQIVWTIGEVHLLYFVIVKHHWN